MSISWWRMSLLAGVAVVCGCSHVAGPAAATPGTATGGSQEIRQASSGEKVIITPETGLIGKVIRVNPAGRFAVLNFPVGRCPRQDASLFIYRQGLKVGEAKASGYQLEDNLVADITVGEAEVGDEVRSK